MIFFRIIVSEYKTTICVCDQRTERFCHCSRRNSKTAKHTVSAEEETTKAACTKHAGACTNHTTILLSCDAASSIHQRIQSTTSLLRMRGSFFHRETTSSPPPANRANTFGVTRMLISFYFLLKHLIISIEGDSFWGIRVVVAACGRFLISFFGGSVEVVAPQPGERCHSIKQEGTKKIIPSPVCGGSGLENGAYPAVFVIKVLFRPS